jgi:DNA-binding beta-propeller fold protein YncE
MRHLAVALWLCSFLLLAGLAFPQTGDAVKNKNHSPLLLVVNQGDKSLSLIDPDGGQELVQIPTKEVRAHEVEASPDGHLAYLPIYGDSGVGRPGTDGSNIEVVDLDKRSVVNTIALGDPARPHCAKFGPDGMLYVSAELENALAVIDPHRQKRVASVPTGQTESHMFVISPDGRTAYTSNVGPGTVSVVDLVAHKTIKVIPVAKMDQRISMSVDGRYVFTADQDQPRLAVIDTAKNEVSRWIALPSVAYGTTPTRDGRWLLATMQSANQVAVVDLAQMKVTRTIDVPAGPVQILMRPDHPIAYVSCMKAGKVAALDLGTWQVAQIIAAGRGADGMAWAAR